MLTPFYQILAKSLIDAPSKVSHRHRFAHWSAPCKMKEPLPFQRWNPRFAKGTFSRIFFLSLCQPPNPLTCETDRSTKKDYVHGAIVKRQLKCLFYIISCRYLIIIINLMWKDTVDIYTPDSSTMSLIRAESFSIQRKPYCWMRIFSAWEEKIALRAVTDLRDGPLVAI